MTTQLNPCPFCGAAAYIVTGPDKSCSSEWYMITCSSILELYKPGICMAWPETSWDRDIEIVSAEWNTGIFDNC